MATATSAPQSEWVIGIAVCVFDLDIGQKVQHIVPAGALSDGDLQAVAFHAFPDSLSMELHAKTSIRDTSFFFRLKQGEGGPAASDARFVYGWVFCRQRQDSSLRRGGEQISVVVLSKHPFSTVLKPLSQVAGPLYFSAGVAALEQVYAEVCAWPPPTSGPLLQLQVGFNTLSCRLPAFSQLPHPSCTTAVDKGPISRATSSGSRQGSRSNSLLDGGPGSAALLPPGPPPRASSQGQGLGLGLGTGGQEPGAASAGLLGRPPRPPGPPGSQGSGLGLGSGALPEAEEQQQPGSSSSNPSSTRDLGAAAAGGAGSGAVPAASSSGGSGGGLLAAAEVAAALQRLGSTDSATATSGDLDQGGPLAPRPGGSTGGAGTPAPTPASSATPPLPQGQQQGGGGGSIPVLRRISLGTTEAAPAFGAFSDSDVFTPLQPQLAKLWHLWELVLLGKPLMVVGPSPADCSGAVAALVSLIAPIPYAPDFRPYFTIHDPAFAGLAAGALPDSHPGSDAPALMGVTNLFFLRALAHWPNVLSVGRKETGSSWPGAAQGSSSGGGWGAAAALLPGSSLFGVGAVKAIRQRAQGAQALLSGHCEALWSGYRPCTRPDNALLTRLLQPRPGEIKSKVARMSYVNSEAIRRHFHELTAALLAPFARYFEAEPDGCAPAWDEAEFLFRVRSPPAPHPAVLMERAGSLSSLVELYGRFIASPNFAHWFTLQRAHLWPPGSGRAGAGAGAGGQAAAGAGGGPGPVVRGLDWFKTASRHLDEVELINLFFSLEQQLRDAQAEADAPDAPEEAEATVARLGRELVTLFLGIGQQDLQLLCISAPQRREGLLAAAGAVGPEQRAQVEAICAQLQ